MADIQKSAIVRDMSAHKTGINGAVAAVLRGELAAQGITQAELATRSGIPVVSVQRYLAPTRAIDIEVLDRMARALSTSAHEVMTLAAARLAREE